MCNDASHPAHEKIQRRNKRANTQTHISIAGAVSSLGGERCAIMMRDNQAIYISIFLCLYSGGISDTIWVLFLSCPSISSHTITISFVLPVNYTQRHQVAQDAMRLSFDENKDEVLKTPSFSLTEKKDRCINSLIISHHYRDRPNPFGARSPLDLYKKTCNQQTNTGKAIAYHCSA